jgi:hypothetical protein
MKIIVKKFFIVIVYLLCMMNTYAKPDPPIPGGKRPPPPPGLPIDEGVYLVFILALFYAIYIIYNHQLKTKTPI